MDQRADLAIAFYQEQRILRRPVAEQLDVVVAKAILDERDQAAVKLIQRRGNMG